MNASPLPHWHSSGLITNPVAGQTLLDTGQMGHTPQLLVTLVLWATARGTVKLEVTNNNSHYQYFEIGATDNPTTSYEFPLQLEAVSSIRLMVVEMKNGQICASLFMR